MRQATLAEIVAAAAKKTETKNGDPIRAQYYSHSKAAAGSTTLLRLLPDGNENSALPWAERFDLTFRFPGLKDSDEAGDGEVVVQVPSAKTWGRPCPIYNATKPLWKGTQADKDLARNYYPRASFVYQGFLCSGNVPEEPPTNPIRLFRFGKQIHETITGALADPDLENSPFDFILGSDYRLVKGSQGGFTNYSKSTFSKKARPLTDDENKAIDQFGLFDLFAQVGPEPDATMWEKQREMLRDSLAGEPYDFAKYGFRYYINTFGTNGSGGGSGSTSGGGDNQALIEALKRGKKAA